MGYSKVTQMGKYLEIKQYERDLTNIPHRPTQRRRGKRDLRLRRYRPDNIGRKVARFQSLVWSNLVGDSNPALVTFTMHEVHGIVSAYQTFSLCVQRLRKRFENSFRYIAVPEFQERGAVHFHMIVWGLPEILIQNEAPHWIREEDIGDMGKIERGTRYLQSLWQMGFVDCLPTDGSPKLAGYLSKYLSKAMSDERLFSQKAYVCSRNILRPVPVSPTQALGYSKEIWGIDIATATPVRDSKYPTHWLGECHNRLFKFD